MKIVISKETLEKAVSNICRVINTKNALPILGDIHFMADSTTHTIHAMGSDSEVWLKYELQANEVSESGQFCVDADLLKKALANIPDQPLEIIVQQGGEYQNMAINHQTGHTIIPGENADEYPMPITIDIDNLPCLGVEVDTIKKPLKRCMYAVCDNPLTPVMNTVFFDYDCERLNIVASNGHVLVKNSEMNEVTKNNPHGLAFMVQKKAAVVLQSLMGDLNGSDDLFFYVVEQQVLMESDNVVLQFRIPEGKYPNYESVMPVATPYSMEVDRMALITAIKNVAPFTSESSNMVVLHIEGQKLTITGGDADFNTSATDTVNIETNFQDGYMNIGMKAAHMIDSLSRLAESRVGIKFCDPSRAVTFSPVDPYVKDETIIILIMPMMLNN